MRINSSEYENDITQPIEKTGSAPWIYRPFGNLGWLLVPVACFESFVRFDFRLLALKQMCNFCWKIVSFLFFW
jgi:hypothetical protein